MKAIAFDSHVIETQSWWARRRRLWISLLILVAVFGGVIGWAYWRGGTALRNAIAEADRLDPDWRIEQIEANRIQIPDEENSALAIIAAKKLIDNSLRNSQNENANHELLDDLKRFPTARMNDEQLKAVAELMNPYRPAMVEFFRVADLPRGRFPIKYSPDFIGTLLNSQDAREASRVFQLVTLECMAANDVPGAVIALKGLINSARSVGDEPLLISILIRIACEAMAFSKLEWFLAQAQPSEAALKELQRMLEDDAKIQLLTLGCRGERGGGFEIFEHMKANPGYMQSIGASLGMGGGGGKLFDFIIVYLPGSISIQQADSLSYMTQAVEVSKLPVEKHAEGFAELSKRVPKLAILARLLCPAIEKVAQAYGRRQANLLCAITALAAERYRLKHGRWPDKLDELVNDGLLKSLPVDPFDGNPLRWKVTDDGRLIYSVGKDYIDNGGNVDPDKPSHDGYDMGFRLFDPGKRGSAPRPPRLPAEPEITNPPNP